MQPMTEISKAAPSASDAPGPHLHHHLSARRERVMFATLGFTATLAVTRGITTLLHDKGAGPNGGLIIGKVHIHHFVFGMIGLLLLGYLWLLLVGFEDTPPRRLFRYTALVYGICSALILDEFALWLNLRDVYWERQGRESIEALLIFGGILLWGALIYPFALAVWHHVRGHPLAPRQAR
jgi:hypothetical protein